MIARKEVNMRLPYNLIHQLEDKFGSLALVPESNPILKKLRQLIFAAEAESKRISQISDDELIVDMLKEGYSNAEVAQEMGVTIKKAHLLAVKCHIKAKPKFKYKVTIAKTGQLIYSGNYQNFSILMHHHCDYYERTKRYLYEEGFKLERLPEFVPWRKLNKGDQYISHRKICVKKVG